jgi:hypothetical protein
VRFAEEVQVAEISCRSSRELSKESPLYHGNSGVQISSPRRSLYNGGNGAAETSKTNDKSVSSLSCSMIERIQEAKNNNKKYE